MQQSQQQNYFDCKNNKNHFDALYSSIELIYKNSSINFTDNMNNISNGLYFDSDFDCKYNYDSTDSKEYIEHNISNPSSLNDSNISLLSNNSDDVNTYHEINTTDNPISLLDDLLFPYKWLSVKQLKKYNKYDNIKNLRINIIKLVVNYYNKIRNL